MTVTPTEYNANFPKSNSSIGNSQPQFLTNFGELYDAFVANHVALDAASNAGNHTVVELVEQENFPQTDVGEISIFTFDDETQTDQLFINYQGNAQQVQFTNYQIYFIKPTATQTTYFTFLPGRVLVCFGTLSPTAITQVLNLVPPVALNIMSANFCPLSTASLNLTSGSSIPNFKIVQNTTDFITQLNVTASFIGQKFVSYFYMVLANI